MQDYRQEFFDFAPTLYLNCAYHGPFPRSTAERIRQAIELKCNPARIEAAEFFGLTERVRERLARLIAADPAEIALTNSATQGIGAVAAGLNWSPGDEVVVASINFPSNLFTWLNLARRGVNVRLLKPAGGDLKIADVAAALTPRTRVLALDWVSYTTGIRLDLAALGELAHRHGALFVVDGTQGVGALELDVHALPVDALAVAAYKWLLGPYGTGFAYLSRALQERLELQVVNWLSVDGSDQFTSLPDDHFSLPKSAKVFDAPATASFLNV
jgi:selenocysteine lyase/cysteine desulfurase